jgi:hypothetical protein
MRQRCPLLMAVAVALVALAGCSSPSPMPPSVPDTAVPPTATTHRPPAAATAQPATDWPMFRYSLDRAGHNPHETSVRPPLEVVWKFNAQSKI